MSPLYVLSNVSIQRKETEDPMVRLYPKCQQFHKEVITPNDIRESTEYYSWMAPQLRRMFHSVLAVPLYGF